MPHIRLSFLGKVRIRKEPLPPGAVFPGSLKVPPWTVFPALIQERTYECPFRNF